jgi:hypothetical protein
MVGWKMSYAYIGDAGFSGVISGWTNYITGSDALTILFVFIFLLIIAFIFKIDVTIALVFLIPFTLVMMAYSVSALFGGFVIAISIVVFSLVFYWIKRF